MAQPGCDREGAGIEPSRSSRAPLRNRVTSSHRARLSVAQIEISAILRRETSRRSTQDDHLGTKGQGFRLTAKTIGE